ncbi:MAG: hypothetical protein IJ916_06305 [Paludibacteraceae bacterium]|nr:hypothetical protein [Paludibacteraceae bacterium]
MRKTIQLLLTIGLSMTIFSASAQKDKGPAFELSNDSLSCDTVWLLTDTPVSYPGGIPEMHEFLYKKMTYNKHLLPTFTATRMMVKVLVSAKGEILKKFVLREINEEFTKDALQAIDQFPLLIPAKRDGVDVCAYWLIPIDISK